MTTHSTPPPAIRTNRRRFVFLFCSALVVAVLLVLVVINIDRQNELPGDSAIGPDVQELVPPTALSEGEEATGIRDIDNNPDLIAAVRGSIEVINPETGEVSQQYRWDRSSPLPDGQLKLEHPVVELYVSDDRILTLQGDEALVRAPNRALEAGVIRGGPGVTS